MQYALEDFLRFRRAELSLEMKKIATSLIFDYFALFVCFV